MSDEFTNTARYICVIKGIPEAFGRFNYNMILMLRDQSVRTLAANTCREEQKQRPISQGLVVKQQRIKI